MAEEITAQVEATAPVEPTPAPAENPAPAEAVQSLGTEIPQEEAQPAEPTEVAPENYEDFNVVEGKPAIPAGDLKDFAAMAKDLNLSQDKAQKLLGTIVPVLTSRLNSNIAAVKQEWASAMMNDPEYGGAHIKENIGVANQAFNKFATPELKKLFQDTGLAQHPDLVRLFYRIGKSMSQDTGVSGQGAPQPKRRLYPNSNMAI